ncbi:MAG: hypothetical protein MK052_04690 [Alphaproteobacteria bacterium]|nr:hypothetical protein [Alphaproteobacteria bacterium]
MSTRKQLALKGLSLVSIVALLAFIAYAPDRLALVTIFGTVITGCFVLATKLVIKYRKWPNGKDKSHALKIATAFCVIGIFLTWRLFNLL